jgi:hypothetical protein
VELPFTSGNMLRAIPGPNDNVLAQFEWEAAGVLRNAILEVRADGRVQATYDLSQQPRMERSQRRMAADRSGKLYCYESWTGDEEKGVPVYVYSPGGDFKERIVLAKRFRPRQLVVTDAHTLVFAGHVPEDNGGSENPKFTQAFFEFRPNGEFLREIVLSRSEDPSNSRDPRQMTMMIDLAHLLTDAAGNFYVVRPARGTSIVKFDASGNILAERELPEAKDIFLIGAVFDDQARLVVYRATARMAGQPAPGEKRRILTVLDSSTLETVLEAESEDPSGVLFSARGGEFFFFARSGPSRVEILRFALR